MKEFSYRYSPQFKKEVLNGMVFAARRVQEFSLYPVFSGCKYIDVPLSFEPSLGDRLIFKKNIEEVLPIILSEDVNIEENPKFIGWQIFVKRYYPYYGQYVENEFRQEFGYKYADTKEKCMINYFKNKS